MYPRAMNNEEREGLKTIKQSGLSYEVKYDPRGGFTANVPELCATYYLRQIRGFNIDLNAHLKTKTR